MWTSPAEDRTAGTVAKKLCRRALLTCTRCCPEWGKLNTTRLNLCCDNADAEESSRRLPPFSLSRRVDNRTGAAASSARASTSCFTTAPAAVNRLNRADTELSPYFLSTAVRLSNEVAITPRPLPLRCAINPSAKEKSPSPSNKIDPVSYRTAFINFGRSRLVATRRVPLDETVRGLHCFLAFLTAFFLIALLRLLEVFAIYSHSLL
mmetsp:Transcript_9498/g.14298  ORF Transcript_9498/g.14298 Transcript_9498/m.14298 type:complete len:207 (+) Transcript_9498:347-967(+)